MVERFALLVCIGIVWAFAAILTAAGAYNNVSSKTKLSCRTDGSGLLSSAPWYCPDNLIFTLYLIGLEISR